MKLSRDYKRILVISDLQIPFEHPDALKFCKALQKRYQPQLVVQIGDYVDLHAFSTFDADPDGFSPSDEIKRVRNTTSKWAKIFPKMYITLGNHDIRVYRKIFKAGIPKEFLRPFNELVGAPKGWQFVDRLRINWEDIRKRLLFVHTGARPRSPAGLAGQEHANVIHGHIHSSYWIKYVATTDALHFDMNVGSLIDDDAYAFEYNKQQTKRPILGAAVIIDGIPRLHPMYLDNEGKWIGKLD